VRTHGKTPAHAGGGDDATSHQERVGATARTSDGATAHAGNDQDTTARPKGAGTTARACDRCLARSWLIGRLAGHLELVRRRIELVLALGDEELIAAVGGEQRDAVQRELLRLDVRQVRAQAERAGLGALCRCDSDYPARLDVLRSPPAALYVAGGLERFLSLVAEEPVAIVGARRATPYGLEIARSLGRALGATGITVLSGMALGIDSAAHAGALSANAATVAVLPCGADRPYPARKRALHAQIRATGAAVSELPPGSGAWRWTFPARNRIIAALGAMTVVVEAGARSGALLTAGFARGLGRPVGAVPGRINAPMASGPNGLLAAGAYVVRGPQDVLDTLYGAGARSTPTTDKPDLAPELRLLLAGIGDGHDTPAALTRAGFAPQDGLAALASLELAGYVRREPGGRFTVMP
jgi:DNA processing protein